MKGVVMKWITKDGRRIPIDQLSYKHLTNIICILESKGMVSFNTWCQMIGYSEDAPDGAAMCIDNELSRLTPNEWLDVLEQEKDRRETEYEGKLIEDCNDKYVRDPHHGRYVRRQGDHY